MEFSVMVWLSCSLVVVIALVVVISLSAVISLPEEQAAINRPIATTEALHFNIRFPL